MDAQLATLKKLRIPFDRKFFNMPMTHYGALCGEIGTNAVLGAVRNLIVDYRGNQLVAEKARVLMHRLEQRYLLEDILQDEIECECGFITMGEEFEKCPVCEKQFYTGKECFYKQDGTICTIDGEECKWASYKECGKLDQEKE